MPTERSIANNLRSAEATDTYICKGGGLETWEPRFTYHGFQYVQVIGLTAPPTLATITGIAAFSANTASSSFDSSSSLVNQIFQNTVWGERSNYFEIPTDCPQRDERQGWTGDAAGFVKTGAYNMDVDAFFTKWMTDVRDAQLSSGAFNDVAPSAIDPASWSPAWGDAGIIVPWTMYLMYGDTKILSANYTAMANYIAFYLSQSPGYIGPNVGYGDWVAIDGNTPLNLISTAYFRALLRLDVPNRHGTRQDGGRRLLSVALSNIRTAFQQHFINADGTIGGNSQTGYLLALGFNLLTPAQRDTAANNLVTSIQVAGWHLTTGFLGTPLLLPVLTDIGRSHVAYLLIQNTTYPSWGYMVEEGATTIWERWDGYTDANGFQDPGMNSFNHYTFGACSQWIMQSMLGISTENAGFQQIVIKPELGSGIDWANGSYDSEHGLISTSWVVTGGNHLALDVTIPVNTTATIYVPTTDPSSVTEGGVPAAQAAGLTFLRYEDGFAVYAALSGTYAFASVLAVPPSPIPPPPPPAAAVHLTFNGNTTDYGTAGNGTIVGLGTTYTAGKFGQAAKSYRRPIGEHPLFLRFVAQHVHRVRLGESAKQIGFPGHPRHSFRRGQYVRRQGQFHQHPRRRWQRRFLAYRRRGHLLEPRRKHLGQSMAHDHLRRQRLGRDRADVRRWPIQVHRFLPRHPPLHEERRDPQDRQ